MLYELGTRLGNVGKWNARKYRTTVFKEVGLMSKDTNNTTHSKRIWSETERVGNQSTTNKKKKKVAPEKEYLWTDRIPTGKGRVS